MDIRIYAGNLNKATTQEELTAAKSLDLFSLCRMLLNANEFIYVD